MVEIEELVALLQSPDADLPVKHEAFAALVYRFQDMAYGYAYAILGDRALAQDAAQEALIAAYRNVDQLQEPRAFPGWLRRIVASRCGRLTRGREAQLQMLPPEVDVPSHQLGPAALLEEREMREAIQDAIRSLPEHQRQATVLYYIDGYSQQEVAEFLEVSLPLTRKWLQRGRDRLRERMLDMVRDDLHAQRPSHDERFLQAVRLTVTLEMAATESQLSVLEAMLVDGLDVNARGKDGRTLLHWAAEGGHYEAAEMLLQHGADPRLADREGKTPQQLALARGQRQVASLLREAEGRR